MSDHTFPAMNVLRQAWQQFNAHWKLAAGVLAAGCVVAVLALAHLIGIFTFERHQGFFAPVWAADGQHVYLIERNTSGITWGFGWEFFSPPASAYVISDRLHLSRLDSATGQSEQLESFDGSPVVGRVTKHYRGRIFNTMSAHIQPTDQGAELLVRMNVPRVPRSETWSLAGTWTQGQPSNAQWSSKWAGSMGTPDQVLKNGVELITVRGREAFPAAVLAVAADGTYRVLMRNDEFDDLYPDGVPAERIAEKASRDRIERVREITRVKAELTAKYTAQGLREGAAILRAYDEMEELGVLQKDPRLVATSLREPPPDVRVFEIPPEYFRVGLFQDIAAAIAAPNQGVRTGTGTYLKYYDDELGPQLKAWRNEGNDRFAVRTAGSLYLLEVRRFDRQ